MPKKKDSFKMGDRVRVIKYGGSAHQFQIGSIVTLETVGPSACTARDDRGYRYTIYKSEFEQLLPETREEIEKLIEELKADIALEAAKLEYLNATKQDTFNQDEFEAYQVLKTVDSDASTLEKAKQIVKILKGGK